MDLLEKLGEACCGILRRLIASCLFVQRIRSRVEVIHEVLSPRSNPRHGTVERLASLQRLMFRQLLLDLEQGQVVIEPAGLLTRLRWRLYGAVVYVVCRLHSQMCTRPRPVLWSHSRIILCIGVLLAQRLSNDRTVLVGGSLAIGRRWSVHIHLVRRLRPFDDRCGHDCGS